MASRQQAKSNRSRQSTTLPGHHAAQEQSALSPLQALGNQFMQTMQPKLNVNAPNDVYEQEADRMAGQVTHMADAAPAVQRAGKDSEKKKEEGVQKKALAAQVTPLVQRAAKEPEKKQEEPAADAQTAAVQREADAPPMEEKKEEAAQTYALQRQEEPKKKQEPKKAETPKKQEAPKKKDEAKAAQTKRANPPQLNDETEKKKPESGKSAGEKKEGEKKEEKEAQTRSLQRAEQGGKGEESKKKPEAPKKQEAKKEEPKKKEETKAAQKKGEQGPSTAPAAVERDIERQERGGRPLDAGTRQYFEPRFGADFSNVRVHDDAEAARAAEQLNAQAFTRGEHLFFGAGQYQPENSPGRQLLAHELTHTLQQGATRPAAAAPAAAAQRAPARRTNLIQRQEEGAESTEDDSQPAPNYARSQEPSGGGGDDTQYRALHEAIRTVGPTLPSSVGRFEPPDHIVFHQVRVPAYKLNLPGRNPYSGENYGTKGKLARFKQYGRRGEDNPKQREKWRKEISKATIREILETKLRENVGGDNAAYFEAARSPRYVLTVPVRGERAGPLYYHGTPTELVNTLAIPSWGRGDASHPPVFQRMQVDHIVELQIGNWGEHQRANQLNNLSLLSAKRNSDSGTFIKEDILAKLRGLIQHPDIVQQQATAASGDSATAGGGSAAQAPAAAGARARRPSVEELNHAANSIKRNFHINFESVVGASGGGSPSALPRDDYWLQEEIESGEHMAPIRVSNFSALGNANEVFVFTRRAGGKFTKFAWPDRTIAPNERRFFRPFELVSKSFTIPPDANAADVANYGTFNVAPKIPGLIEGEHPGLPFSVERIRGSQYAGFFNLDGAKAALNRVGLNASKLSPITIDEMDIIETGIYLRGRITADVPLIRGTSIDFELENGDLRAYKQFTAPEFAVPAPLQVNAATLTLSIGTRSGLAGSGRVDFGIQRLGTGYLEARVSSERGFALAGGFNFDTKLFDPARISMRYEDGEFSGEGEIGIPSGKVRGVRSARVTMSYAQQRFTANGTVQPAIPGVREGNLGIVYSEQEGLVISGSLQLAENPAIRSGSIEARVEQKPDGTYKVRASGTAQPKVPGVDSQLTVTYDDGAFDAEVTASYARGMLRGSLRVAATNRAVDPATGQPAGEPTDQITVYGGGQVTVRFSPWLEGTAGIRLLPNGEIEISGTIGLPSTVNIFDARRFDRNIFRINIDIPIVGVSVAGQRIGIFATIGGGLDLTAGIGPGQLRNLSLSVTYNPSHEDQTHVVGHGELYIPADAGLRLSIRGGIGVGIPIVSATAGIEVGGQLGLEGAATASVNVDWTPTQGIVLDAVGEIYVEPKLKLDVSAYVEVTADLLLTEIELYSKRWRLANYEFGSGLRFGVRFPVHYQEGQPFNVSMDDLEFQIPEIDPSNILAGILE